MMPRVRIRTRVLAVLLVPAVGLLAVLGLLVVTSVSMAGGAAADQAGAGRITTLGMIALVLVTGWVALLAVVLRNLDRAVRTSADKAIRVASDQARTRAGIIRTIEDVARREQALVDRQLALLDHLEDAEEDPDQLSALFRLDHLATRMRRNAENLLLLTSGQLPGGDDPDPVVLVDVVRSAAAEIEDYARVDVRVGVDATVQGRAATPLSHLIAELVENATRFSPPHTRVTVRGRVVPDGVAVIVTDEGVGLSATELAEAGRTLADPPLLEVAESRRLGLYVVGLIAAQLGVTVDLAPGPAGRGTAVDVLIPGALFDPPLQVSEPPCQPHLHAVPDLPPVPIPMRPAAADALHTTPDVVAAMQQLLDAEPSAPPALPDDVPAPLMSGLPSRQDRSVQSPGAVGVSLAAASAGHTVDVDPVDVGRLMRALAVQDARNTDQSPADRPPAPSAHDGVASSWTTPFPPLGA